MQNMQADDCYMSHYTGAADLWLLRSWWGTVDIAGVLKARKQIKKEKTNSSTCSLRWFMLSNPYLIKQSCSGDRGGKLWELHVPHRGLTNHIGKELNKRWANLCESAECWEPFPAWISNFTAGTDGEATPWQQSFMRPLTDFIHSPALNHILS